MKTPILLLFYNRLDCLLQVLEVVKQYRPDDIYLSSDGPRDINDFENIKYIREKVLEYIDWNCNIHLKFENKNLGCKNSVDKAIKWFFNNEKMGIILEDDVVPSLNFLLFCQDTLIFFENNMQIGSITGRNNLGEWGGSDIIFSNRFNCWGWASWRNRLENFNVNYGYDKKLYYRDLFCGINFYEKCYIHSVLGYMQSNIVNSWAYPYDLNFRKRGFLHIYPKMNMIKNIGYGASGTHSKNYEIDTVPQFFTYRPNNFEVIVKKNQKFINQNLINEYSGILRLITMRYSATILKIKSIFVNINN